jgi:vancomycin resistance protein VanW
VTFVVPERLAAPPRLTERHPWLLPIAVGAHRTCRRLRWLTSGLDWASRRSDVDLPERLMTHASVLVREVPADHEVLQHNKVVNLRLASQRVDGLLLRPGETFSFNKVVGNCTRRKGYLDGLRLARGHPATGVGGGICQLANLLHWMFLHSALTVVERSEHSFDPFPDAGRVVPWGVGCTIVYNYVDLVVRNDTTTTYQLRVRVTEHHLRGELRADRPGALAYRVEARDEQFLRVGERVFRRNEIWRTTSSVRTGAVLGEQLVKANCAVVRYPPDEARIVEME